MPRVLGIVMAGGRGDRLQPLTRSRSKAAVPFGARHRLIDYVLSNFVNSGIYALYVLVQYKSQSLIEHVSGTWRIGGRLPETFVTVVPPQMRGGETWYRGTADAVFQNLNLIRDFGPELVAVFGADHIYRMDLRQMIQFHLASRADATVAARPVPLAEAPAFGIMTAAADGRIGGFVEKPRAPEPMPGDPASALASMGNYVFTTGVLTEELMRDAACDEVERHWNDRRREIGSRDVDDERDVLVDVRRRIADVQRHGLHPGGRSARANGERHRLRRRHRTRRRR